MAIHRLKLNSAYYNDSASGIKTFEIRKNDRNFQVGDILELREWVWSDLEQKGAHTGEVHWKVITYILEDTEHLHDGFVCLAVSPIAEVQRRGRAAEKELDDAQPCFACAGFQRNGGKCFGAGTCRVRDIARLGGVEYKDKAHGESWRWRGLEKVEMQENIEAVLRAVGDQ